MQQLLDLTRPELTALLAEWGQPRYRADQVWHWLYKGLQDDPQQMSNLPAVLRARLANETSIQPLAVASAIVSSDHMTRKLLFELPDRQTIEAVLMLYDKRRTICISTQAGCGMGCTFCATGQGGLARNLTAGEIVAQVLYFARWLADPLAGGADASPVERPTTLSNIVLMGMGEPLANYKNVWEALHRITDAESFGLGARHITLSTVGLVPGIEKMSHEPLQINLAVSLHAPTDELRNQLVPINHRYPIAKVIKACHDYVATTNRRITFEYALMRGINDSREQAVQMANLLHGLLCHVNLIPLNPVVGSPYQPSSVEDTRIFVETLNARGIPATLRLRRGIDIDAGCGQLRARANSHLPTPVSLYA